MKRLLSVSSIILSSLMLQAQPIDPKAVFAEAQARRKAAAAKRDAAGAAGRAKEAAEKARQDVIDIAFSQNKQSWNSFLREVKALDGDSFIRDCDDKAVSAKERSNMLIKAQQVYQKMTDGIVALNKKLATMPSDNADDNNPYPDDWLNTGQMKFIVDQLQEIIKRRDGKTTPVAPSAPQGKPAAAQAKDDEMSTCRACGYTWKTGTSGEHKCKDRFAVLATSPVPVVATKQQTHQVVPSRQTTAVRPEHKPVAVVAQAVEESLETVGMKIVNDFLTYFYDPQSKIAISVTGARLTITQKTQIGADAQKAFDRMKACLKDIEKRFGSADISMYKLLVGRATMSLPELKKLR